MGGASFYAGHNNNDEGDDGSDDNNDKSDETTESDGTGCSAEDEEEDDDDDDDDDARAGDWHGGGGGGVGDVDGGASLQTTQVAMSPFTKWAAHDFTARMGSLRAASGGHLLGSSSRSSSSSSSSNSLLRRSNRQLEFGSYNGAVHAAPARSAGRSGNSTSGGGSSDNNNHNGGNGNEGSGGGSRRSDRRRTRSSTARLLGLGLDFQSARRRRRYVIDNPLMLATFTALVVRSSLSIQVRMRAQAASRGKQSGPSRPELAGEPNLAAL